MSHHFELLEVADLSYKIMEQTTLLSAIITVNTIPFNSGSQGRNYV